MPREPKPNREPGARTRRRARTDLVSPAPGQLVTHNSELVTHHRPSAVIDTRVIYCGDCLDQLSSEPRPPALYVAQRCQGSGSGLLPDGCVDRVYVWHRFPTGEPNSNRNYEVFWGRQSEPEAQARGIPEPRAQASRFLGSFGDRQASTAAYVAYVRPG